MIAVARRRVLWTTAAIAGAIGLALASTPAVHLIGQGKAVVAGATAKRVPGSGLVAVLDAPFGSAPNAIRLFEQDGAQRARVILRSDAEAVVTAGPRVLVIGGGRLDAIDRSGLVVELGAIPDDAPDELIKGLVASPDGSLWMWASLRTQADGGVRSRIYIDDEASGPRLILERVGYGHSLQPVAWTAGGPVLGDEPDGIGGYVLFRHAFGPTFHLDVPTGALTQVAAETCAFSDMAADGSVSCVNDGKEGANSGGPVQLSVLRHATTTFQTPLDASVRQAGAAFFQPGGHLLTLSTSPALGQATEDILTVLLDDRRGGADQVTFSGLQPVQWINHETILMTRGRTVRGGRPGTYVVHVNGSAQQVSSNPYAIGVMRDGT